MDNIDLMMKNTPGFPQREGRSTCCVAEIMTLSLEDISHGAKRKKSTFILA